MDDLRWDELGWIGASLRQDPNIGCIARSRSSKQIGGDFPLDIELVPSHTGPKAVVDPKERT